jgi:hypothetical protein
MAARPLIRYATDRQHFDRPRIVRPAHRLRMHKDIAADIGIAPRTVQRWLNAYLGGGLDGLRSRKARGNALATRPSPAWFPIYRSERVSPTNTRSATGAGRPLRASGPGNPREIGPGTTQR